MFGRKRTETRRTYAGHLDAWTVTVLDDQIVEVRLDVFEDLCALAGYTERKSPAVRPVDTSGEQA